MLLLVIDWYRSVPLVPSRITKAVSSAPHSMYWETPDLFTDALRKFLAEVYPG